MHRCSNADLLVFQTPTLLLTPSPLLSNIHFWSTLSPVAPLSPATRRQGAHLFQVSTLGCSTCLWCSFYGKHLNTFCSAFSVSNSPHTPVPDPCAQYGWDQHTWSHFTRPSEDIGVKLPRCTHTDTLLCVGAPLLPHPGSSLPHNSHYSQLCGGKICLFLAPWGVCTRTHWCHHPASMDSFSLACWDSQSQPIEWGKCFHSNRWFIWMGPWAATVCFRLWQRADISIFAFQELVDRVQLYYCQK